MTMHCMRRLSWLGLLVSAALGSALAYGQQAAAETLASHRDIPGAWLGELTAQALLGIALVASLGVNGLLVRYMAGRWSTMVERSITVGQQVEAAMKRCEERSLK